MDGRERRAWDARHRAAAQTETAEAPSPFVVQALDLLGAPLPDARALDVACGRGRHALLLAARGYRVEAVDCARSALVVLRERALVGGLAVAGIVADVTTWPLPAGRYELVVVVSFLERGLFPALRAAVAPGGALLMETFLSGQERHGHPTNPAYLLAPGELADTCRGWPILAAHEGETRRDGRPVVVAGILARRPC